MSGRNRAEGWQHAKISGHEYERIFENAINKGEKPLLKELQDCLVSMGRSPDIIECSADAGTSRVDDFCGGKTTSKADAHVTLKDGHTIGISIKKSDGGQVQLTSLERFVSGIQHQTGNPIPKGALWSLQALTGETGGITIESFAKGVTLTDKTKRGHTDLLEREDNRLLAKTIKREFPKEWTALTEWFRLEFEAITRLVFSRGYCANQIDWAEIVHYRNKSKTSSPIFIPINDIVNCTGQEHIDPSPGQGSTLWLPWGFLQVHRPTPSGKPKSGPFQLQFHHKRPRMLEHIAT